MPSSMPPPMLVMPRNPIAEEAVISWKPWSVSMGTPWAESRLIEKPQEKRAPPICQKDGVRSASLHEPARQGGQPHHLPGGREPQGSEHAVVERELPQ